MTHENTDLITAPPRGVDRRTLLRAGAWAAPVIALTAASPAMAASVGVDIQFTSPQAGSGNPWVYNTVGQQRMRLGVPERVRVVNAGTSDFNGPVTVTLQYDVRVWEVTDLEIDSISYGDGSPTTSGNLVTHTWVLPMSLAASSGNFVDISPRSDILLDPDAPVVEFPVEDPLWTMSAPNTSSWPMPNGPIVDYSGVTLAFAEADLGDAAVTVLTPDGTGSYTPAGPDAVRLVNSGTSDLAPGVGFALAISYDHRIWELTGLTFGADPTVHTSWSEGWDGALHTSRYEISGVGIPAGADGLVVRGVLQVKPGIDGSALDPAAVPVVWELVDPLQASLTIQNGPVTPLP